MDQPCCCEAQPQPLCSEVLWREDSQVRRLVVEDQSVGHALVDRLQINIHEVAVV